MDSRTFLYLSRADVERAAPDMTTLIAILEQAFREKAQGRVEMPPKLGIHPQPDSFLHAMPAHIRRTQSAGIKWVGGSPENVKKGLPIISGLIVLNDVETLLPCAVMDCTWITAHRTAAASVLAAKFLARPRSETLGILACGMQGRTHLPAMAARFSIKTVYAYDVNLEACRRFVEEMAARTGLEIIEVDSPRRAIEDSDIVVTSGPMLKDPRPIADKGWLKPGAFASAVDYDSYWTPAALVEMDKLATDDLAQFRHAQSTGYFQRMPEPYAELGDIVIGVKPGREREDERTMAMNLGIALADIAVALEVYRRARDLGIGTWLPL
jgi:ornithine cyclodeaminase/alanine dehydrogenase-like protein (mu-crystallin family)